MGKQSLSRPSSSSRRRGLGRDLFSCVAAVGLIASLLTALAPQPASAAESPVPAIADASHASDEQDAREIARAHGHEVIVDSQSSPNLLILARPDGAMEARSSQVPEQAKVGAEWKTIDTSLVEKDGWWVPKVAAVPIRIGRGGSNAIVQVRSEDGSWVTETWAYGALPTPRVSKNAATFADVFPDVDLRVTATKAGMREVLIVKTAAAAKDDRLGSLTFRIEGATLQTHPETGTLSASAGEELPLVASTPLWWDSSERTASADGPGAVEVQAVPVEQKSDTDSVMDVDAITSTDITYPLYVDPDWSAYLQSDWFTDRAFPNQSYLNPPENSVGYGIQNGIHYLSRAFYRFDTAFLKGKIVQSAQFTALQTYANSCDQTLVQLWQYGQSDAGFTWNSDPNRWARLLDQQGNSKGGPCDPNPGRVGFSATVAAQEATVLSENYLTLALRSANEGSSLTRKHYRWDAQLIVTYNTPPNVPTDLMMLSPSRPCSTDPSDPVYINNDMQKTLMRVHASDPDGGNVTANVYLRRESTGTVTSMLGTVYLAAGSELMHEAKVKTLAKDELYSWVARSSDGSALSGESKRCYFVNDTSSPALPTVEVVSDSDPGEHGSVLVKTRPGEPITVRISTEPADGVAGFQAWWTYGDRIGDNAVAPAQNYTAAIPPCDSAEGPARVVCSSGNGPTTITVAPISTNSTLWVASYDKAGNVSRTPAGSLVTATGVNIQTRPASLGTGHAWTPDATGLPSIEDSKGSLPLVVGSVPGWTESDEENPALEFSSLLSVTQYVKANVGHVATVEGVNTAPGGSVIESPLGQVLRYTAGRSQPPNTRIVYQCAFGTGNALSLSATCEGKGVDGKPVGYSWKSKPTGYATAEVFRCHSANDYFASLRSDCVRYTMDGSLGYFAQASPLPTTTSYFAEDSTLAEFGTASLTQYVKPAVGHTAVIGGVNSFSDGSLVESELGMLVRYVPGMVTPSGMTLVYVCAFGDGNALSASSSCEGKASAGTPAGYTWSTKPSGYETAELFRCHAVNDYFASLRSDCIRYTTDGSLGFVLTKNPDAPAIDTTSSFTVSVRVKAASTKGTGTVASSSAFSLQSVDGSWRFCILSQGGTATKGCASGGEVKIDRFSTVSGVWDAVNKQVRIAVHEKDTFSSASATYFPPADDRSGTGPLVIGSSVARDAASGEWFDGSVADAAIYPAIPSETQLRRSPLPHL